MSIALSETSRFFIMNDELTCLITGGSGMIGDNINFGYKPTSKEMDITNYISIENYINNLDKKISCIIHLAALNLRES